MVRNSLIALMISDNKLTLGTHKKNNGQQLHSINLVRHRVKIKKLDKRQNPSLMHNSGVMENAQMKPILIRSNYHSSGLPSNH